MTEIPPVPTGISRRTAVTRIAVGTAAVWAAPSITTLGSRAFAAGSSVSVVLDFAEDDERTGIPSGTKLSDFTVADGNIDVVGGTTYPELSDGGTKVADLDGTAAMTAMLVSNMTFAPGSYTVSYVASGSRRPGVNGDTINTIMVTLGNNSSTQAIPAGSITANTYTFSTVLLAAAQLVVSHQSPDGGSVGNLLYSVTVTKTN